MASKKRVQASGDNPELVIRAFGGMSNNAARFDIEDEEFYWLLNLMPMADGRLLTVPTFRATAAVVSGEPTLPVYTCPYTINGVNFVFVVFASGHSYSVNLEVFATAPIHTFTMPVAAVAYNDQGLLILAPDGYFDYNLTTPFNVTGHNNTVVGASITLANVLSGGLNGVNVTVSNNGLSPNDGTGASLKVYYKLVSLKLSAAGTNFVVGDVLTLSGGTPESAGVADSTNAAVIVVTSVSGTGAITGFSISTAGSYAGPVTGNTAGVQLPGGAQYLGGSGSGATFLAFWTAIPGSAFVVNPGSGYAGGEVSQDLVNDPCVGLVASLTSGSITGVSANNILAFQSDTNGDSIVVQALPLTQGGPGVGGQLQTAYNVTGVNVLVGGSGYQGGDVLTITGGSDVITAATVNVTGVTLSGSITTVTLAAGGTYGGPITGLTAVLPGGATSTGGHGSGAVLKLVWQANGTATVVAGGSGYTGSPVSGDVALLPTTAIKLMSSGVVGGSAIATYAGRVWLANNKSVFFTEVDTFNNFGGSGSNFTVNDSYLHGPITALFSSNNYLYIFGQDSIDALSNVSVANGLTSFSRINLVTGVGTSSPQSVVGFFRGVAFINNTGVYLLAGATPDKVSKKIQGLIRFLTNVNPLTFGCLATVNGELCLAMSVTVGNQAPAAAPLAIPQGNWLILYYDGKWFAASMPSSGIGPANVPVFSSAGGNGLPILIGNQVAYTFGITGANCFLYQMFVPFEVSSPWQLMTKLWDAGVPFREKQAMFAAIASTVSGPNPNVALSVDTETQSFVPVLPPVENATPPASTGYALLLNLIQGGASQYLGFTMSGSYPGTPPLGTVELNLIALRALAERDILQ